MEKLIPFSAVEDKLRSIFKSPCSICEIVNDQVGVIQGYKPDPQKRDGFSKEKGPIALVLPIDESSFFVYILLAVDNQYTPSLEMLLDISKVNHSKEFNNIGSLCRKYIQYLPKGSIFHTALYCAYPNAKQ